MASAEGSAGNFECLPTTFLTAMIMEGTQSLLSSPSFSSKTKRGQSSSPRNATTTGRMMSSINVDAGAGFLMMWRKRRRIRKMEVYTAMSKSGSGMGHE